MKYICLGYMEPGKFEGMTEDEQHAMFDECFEYNDHLRANGHVVVAAVSVFLEYVATCLKDLRQAPNRKGILLFHLMGFAWPQDCLV